MKKRILFISILIILGFIKPVKSQLISDTTLLSHMMKNFSAQSKIVPERFKEFSNVSEKLSKQELQAMYFLYAYMPLSDLIDYPVSFFLENVRLALQTKTDFAWGKTVSEQEFLHFVLPPRVNNENLDSFRIVMYDTLKARISGLSMMDAALEINHWCHEKVTYKGTDSRTGSPLCTMDKAFGRCGEESVFTVAALRTVGIPARQVYTPRWAHTDDNHAWVEACIDGKWYFLGACEPESALNKGWFEEPVKRAMLVHTRAFGWYNGTEPVVSRNDMFSELNLTYIYAPVKKFFVKVLNADKSPADSAKVEYQIYNYAEFFPIAKNYTNKSGLASLETGLGDMIVWANKNNSYAYQKITVELTDTLVLTLSSKPETEKYLEFDFVPPVPGKPTVSNETDKQNNDKRLKNEDIIRNKYTSTFKDSVWAVSFAKKFMLNKDSACYIVSKSYGNSDEIEKYFMNVMLSAKPLDLSKAMTLLYTVSEKDLSDSKANVLLDHLKNCENNASGIDKNIYQKYLLSPRISDEKLSTWRSFLQNKFDKSTALKAKENPELLVNWVKQNIVLNNTANLFSRLIISSEGVFTNKIADSRSRDVFFVALCRSLNIPARLNPETSVPEYYKNKEWQKVNFSNVQKPSTSKGYIRFISEKSVIVPQYSIHFSIAAFKNGVYRTLTFEEEKKVTDFPDSISLDTGRYMLVTGNRQSDGSVLCAMAFFTVSENSFTNVHVRLRDAKMLTQSMGKVIPADYSLTQNAGTTAEKLDKYTKSKGAIIVFIDPDKEPSKHVIQDLAKVSDMLAAWGGSVLFVTGKDLINAKINFEAYGKLPESFVFVSDAEDKLYVGIRKFFKCNESMNLPLVTFIDSSGDIYFYTEGYRIGVGEQLLKLINALKK